MSGGRGCLPSSCSSGSLTPSPEEPGEIPAVEEMRPSTIWEPSGEAAVPDIVHSASGAGDVGSQQLPESLVSEICQSMGCACGIECPGRTEAQMRLDIVQIGEEADRVVASHREFARGIRVQTDQG